MSEKKPLRRKSSTVEEDLRFLKAQRNKLFRTPKDTPLKQRRKAEKLAQLDDYIKQLEPIVETERIARKEAARFQQIRENGERHEAERLAAENTERAHPPEEQPKQRIAFDIGGRHFVKWGDRLVEMSAVRLPDGSWVDKSDNEPVKMVVSYPQPVPGAKLRDDGEWLLPEIKPTPVPQPPNFEPRPGDIRLDHAKLNFAMKAEAKVRALGYQARVMGDVCMCLYDCRLIPVEEWKQKMRSVFSATVLADL